MERDIEGAAIGPVEGALGKLECSAGSLADLFEFVL